MNVGSGGKSPHHWSRRTKTPPLEGIRSYPEGIRSRSLKKWITIGGEGNDGISFLPPLPTPQWTWRARNHPPPPLYIVGRRMGASPLAPPPLLHLLFLLALGEALPENHELHHHHAVVLSEFSVNFSSPLAGSRRRRRPRAVRVLNTEVLLFGA